MIKFSDIKKINDWIFEIPKSFRKDMRVPARIFASEKMLKDMMRDQSLEQLINVTTLPGIQKYAIGMPDLHEGYGFPVGGVGAFDVDSGIISPGGIGYDINCGVRLLKSEKYFKDLKPLLNDLSAAIYREVPSGVGRSGRLKLNNKELDEILNKGAKKIIQMGYGFNEDLECIESNGCLDEANSDLVSSLAKKRGHDQIGTMGAGNHFVEVDRVEEIFDQEYAAKYGLNIDQIVILIHTGSRGLGHQVATDYIRVMLNIMHKYNISISDRELACAPFNSKEGQEYFAAMSCAANFAWANRQMITWEVREAWDSVFGTKGGILRLIYDVAHNIAKVEKYNVEGKEKTLVVHRKGATRSFPDQPVIIPGSMGTASYLLVGCEKSMEETFGSTCHGAGRRLSRHQAMKEVRGEKLREEMKNLGIAVNAGSYRGLAEEAPLAYKNVDEVVDEVDVANIAKKVAKFKPVAVIKG